uniref:Uncharacterized protein n=1 Tax=Panagrolaimus superbus TaxID=310955 RepID=A0A914YM10_9BILA
MGKQLERELNQRDCVTLVNNTVTHLHPHHHQFATCGGGYRTRQRTCNTQCSVCQCQGPSTEQEGCNTQPCQVTTCNTCNNPPPPPPPACSTCNVAPPACSTCGGTPTIGGGITQGSNAYYDPYRNGKKRRRRHTKTNSETIA